MSSPAATRRLLMLFVDGVGIGKRDTQVNPFLVAHLPALRLLCNGDVPTLRKRRFRSADATVLPLDATLGVEGFPQSGTGQTALFTGVNAARLIGRHFGPYPYSTLRPLLQEQSIFAQCQRAGKSVCFANAFPQRFFDYVAERPTRLSAASLACNLTGVPLRRHEDLLAGNGVSADITGAGWRAMGYDKLPLTEAAEAGRRLALLTASYDFVLFEYWKTDHVGHAQSMQEGVKILELFDALVGGVIAGLDTRTTLLCITSDHGNIEDLSVKTHTRNPVPMILYGHKHVAVAHHLESHKPRLCSLHHVTPLLMEYLTGTL